MKYIVCSSDMGSGHHDNFADAKKEAERLCRKGIKVFVYELIAEVCVSVSAPVTWQWARPASTCTGSGSGWCDCPPDTEDGDPTP